MVTQKPNVLFLMSDQHSFRGLSYRDPSTGEPVDTPTLDRLATSGANFERTYCPSPLCTPARLSLLTGMEAHNAGAWELESVLKPELPTLPGTLSRAGYNTCLIGKMHLGGSRQSAGFDHRPYGDLTGQAGHQIEDPNVVIADDGLESFITDVGVTDLPESILQEQNTVQESLSFLRRHRNRNPDQPWFLCASFSRPHWPRTAPERHFDRYWPDSVTEPKVEYDPTRDTHPMIDVRREMTGSKDVSNEQTLRARAAYFACIDYLDEIIGDLLTLLERDGFLDNTIVVYTSDHGEMAGEHGIWEKSTWHEASVRVPLFVQLPEHRSGAHEPVSISTPVSLIDLFPTLCGLSEISAPDSLEGVDLSDAILRGSEPNRGPVFVDSFVPYAPGLEYRMIRDGRYKYVQFDDAPERLYDLTTDPLEKRNLVGSLPDEQVHVLSEFRAQIEETIDFERIKELRDSDEELKHEYRLGVAKGTPNQYHFPDDRIVDADSVIYHPRVIADDPDVVYDDFPSK